MSRKTFFQHSSRTQRARPAKTRLEVELLESRCVLSNMNLTPLVQVSGSGPFAGCTADNVSGQPGTNFLNSEVEPWVAVNPTNARNVVAIWQQDRWSNGGARGHVAAASFDGGNTWRQVIVPGLTLCSGGAFQRATDPWLSFAPNGHLYQISMVVDFEPAGVPGRNAMLVSKSTDGGLTWSSPITLIADATVAHLDDKETITADPTNSNFAYAVWTRSAGATHFNQEAVFARTTDGGLSWEPARTIYQSPTGEDANIGHQILVLPDGTLVDTFTEVQFSGSQVTGRVLSVLRSLDKGGTWQPVIRGPEGSPIAVTDPDTGQRVRTGAPGIGDVAVDPNTGHLYAVWEDAAFSGGQYNSIAFSMSTNGGLSWSEPTRINKTPDNIPLGNRQAFTPSIDVAADGTVAVSYYDFRNNTPDSGLSTDYWFIHAHPNTDLTHPSNWGDEKRITKKSFNMEQAPLGGGFFLGDYQGLASAGNSFMTLFAQPHGTDPASIFFRDPPPVGSTLDNILVNDPTADLTVQDTQSDTAIVLGAGNRIVVAYNDTGSAVGGAKSRVGWSLSNDAGDSFRDQGTVPIDPDHGPLSLGVLARSSSTGTVFLTTNSGLPSFSGPPFPHGEQINVYRSTNNGSTFQLPVNGTPGFVRGVDRQNWPWIAVDNFPGPGQGNVYLAWRDESSDRTKNGILFTRSMDDGLTWRPNGGTVIEVHNSGGYTHSPVVAVGTDHAVYVPWFDQTGSTEIRLRKSTDHGMTFGPPVTVAPLRNGQRDLNLGDFFAFILPQMAVNPVNGDLYVVYPDDVPGNDRADILFTYSTNGGATWSTPVRVNDDATPNDQWAPALAVTPDGSNVGVFWYDRRLDPTNNLIDRFGVVGTVSAAGVSFGPNFRITDVSFPPAFGQDPLIHPSYMGFRGDQAAADNSFFYVTWGDNRLGNAFHTNQPDVRFAKIPVAGMAALHADSAPANPVRQSLTPAEVQPVLDAALPRWQLAGLDTVALSAIDIRIADLGGTTLGIASGHTIWLDDNAAGWGWFVDPTPGDDSEFTTPGNQGEQHRMDLLTVLAHEIGHLLGHNHEDDGVMADTLGLGVRHMLDTTAWSVDAAIIEWALTNKK